VYFCAVLRRPKNPAPENRPYTGAESCFVRKSGVKAERFSACRAVTKYTYGFSGFRFAPRLEQCVFLRRASAKRAARDTGEGVLSAVSGRVRDVFPEGRKKLTENKSEGKLLGQCFKSDCKK